MIIIHKYKMYSTSYNRDVVAGDPYDLYIFTDNCSRTSGTRKINPNSWYSKEFGQNLCYPTRTSACIRGLDNALPITTMKSYVRGGDYKLNRWTDNDIKEFEEVIDKDIERIKEYIRTHVCHRVFIPNGGFFGTKISYITKSRCPKIYNYLVIKLDELQLYINTYNPKLWD